MIDTASAQDNARARVLYDKLARRLPAGGGEFLVRRLGRRARRRGLQATPFVHAKAGGHDRWRRTLAASQAARRPAPVSRIPYPGWAARAGSIVFASRRLGWWLNGQGLRCTRDGGKHWRTLSLDGSVDALAVSAGTAYAVVSPPVSGRPSELFRSPAGRAAWARVGT